MAVDVVHAVLPFSIFRFMQFFPYDHSPLLGSGVVSVHVPNHDGERLSPGSEQRGALRSPAWPSQHDDRASEKHLNPGYRLAIAEILFKAKGTAKPIARLVNVAVNQVGKHG